MGHGPQSHQARGQAGNTEGDWGTDPSSSPPPLWAGSGPVFLSGCWCACWAQGTAHDAVHCSPGLPAFRARRASQGPKAGLRVGVDVDPCPVRGACRQQSLTPPPASPKRASPAALLSGVLQATCSQAHRGHGATPLGRASSFAGFPALAQRCLALREPPNQCSAPACGMWGRWISGTRLTHRDQGTRPFPSPASVRNHRPRAWPGPLETQGHP